MDLHTKEGIDEEGDQIMEEIIDFSSKRAQQSPKCGEPSKKSRLLQVEGISEEDPVAQVTTLLKAISFESIQPITYGTPEEVKEYEEGIKELEENRVIIHESGEKTGLYDDNYINEIRMRGFDPGPDSISAGPVLQIISVSILKEKDNHNDPDREEFGIYGYILLTDYLRNTYYIYNSPEQVSKNWNLLLNICPIAPVMGPKLKFSLTDVDGTVKIFDQDKDYYLKDTLDCEKVESQDFVGEGGYVARVVFNRAPLAVIVELQFFLGYNPISYEEGTND